MKASINALYRYPVKSMGGHALQRSALTAKGIPGDRAWTLKDEERGGIKGGKRFPQLLSMSASFTSEPTAQVVSPPESMLALLRSLDHHCKVPFRAAMDARGFHGGQCVTGWCI